MNNVSQNQASQNQAIARATLSIAEDHHPDTTQYITFELEGYLFALPSREILRIVKTPPPSQGGLIAMGMVQLGPYSIQIIDLVALLALKSSDRTAQRPSVSSSRALETRKKRRSPDNPDQNPPFLVVLQNEAQEFWGIALHEPPDLMEVPNYALKPVPAHQRRSQALQWVSHMVSYELNSTSHSLLILDLSVVLNHEDTVAHFDEKAKFMPLQPPLDPLR